LLKCLRRMSGAIRRRNRTALAGLAIVKGVARILYRGGQIKKILDYIVLIV
jgi:hypothetical protein